VCAIEFVELTRDIEALPFLDGVAGAGKRAELVSSEVRGLLTAMESDIGASIEPTGRFRAWDNCGDSDMLS
jgi:hypothetical protein